MEKASNRTLSLYLSNAARSILKAVTGYERIQDFGAAPEYINPIWLGLSALYPYGKQAIEKLVADEELTRKEADMLLAAQAAGADFAKSLRPRLWMKSGVPNKSAILQAYALCQTSVLDRYGGSYGNGELAARRQRWYFSKLTYAMGFKFASFALDRALILTTDVVLCRDEREAKKARRIGAKNVHYVVNWSKSDKAALKAELGRAVRTYTWPKEGWGRVYDQLQSGMFANLVRSGLTYESLWIEDASRKFSISSPLFNDFYAVFVIEKESLLKLWKPLATALGIPMLVAMSGNCAFSAIEHLLNNHFRGWNGDYTPSARKPLHLFALTDYDPAGLGPVMAVKDQFRRYLPNAVKVHRIGILPEQVRAEERSVIMAGVLVDAEHNKAYREWADEYGLWVGDDCYGLEVEALDARVYVEALVDAIVEAVGGDDALADILIKAAQPDWWTIRNRVSADTWKKTVVHGWLDRIEEWVSGQRYNVENEISALIEGLLERTDFFETDEVREKVAGVLEGQRELITRENYKEHAGSARSYKWEPVDGNEANDAVVELVNGVLGQMLDDVIKEYDEKNLDLIASLRDAAEILSQSMDS